MLFRGNVTQHRQCLRHLELLFKSLRHAHVVNFLVCLYLVTAQILEGLQVLQDLLIVRLAILQPL